MGLFTPLALVALPLLGVIIALYLLKLRRPVAPIASLYLWSSLTHDREANSLWQRLRVSLLLLLQVVALALLILAIARPWVRTAQAAEQSVIIIVDVSASMGASSAGPGSQMRLQVAQSKARDLIDGLQDGTTATLISSDDHASILVTQTTDKARLRGAVDALTPAATGTDMTEALRLAGALVSRQAGSAIWLLSDGAFPSTADLSDPISAPFHFYQIGSANANQGITALSLQQRGGSLSLFVQVANADTISATRRVDLTIDDTPWTARTVKIGPGAVQELIVDDVPLAARVIQAALDGPDALATDDQAWVVNRASAPANLLLVTGGNKFLETALSLLPTVTLYKVSADDYNPAATINGAPVDLTIFDAGTVTATRRTLPQSNLLFFAPLAPNSLISVTGVISQPLPTLTASFAASGDVLSAEASNGEPLLRYVDLTGLHVAAASAVEVPKWGRVVLASDKGPLIIAGETQGRKVGVITFDLHDSDLPVQTAYPLLMRNLITYLLPDPSGGLPANIVPRTSVGIDAATPQISRIVVEDPSAKEWSYDISPARPRVAFAETSQQGVYYVTQYAGADIKAQDAFAANLFSRDETMTPPNKAPGLPQAQAAARQTASQPDLFKRELWPSVALLGVLVLLLEWLYAQRIAVRRAWTEWQGRRALQRTDRM